MAIPAEYLRAARRFGPELDDIAQKYRNPVTGQRLTGTALLLKTAQGESGYRRNAESSAGARGPMQFMPGTRQAVLEKTGGKVDPWRSVEEAMHAAVLHLTGKLGHTPGLEGYNPGGGQGYVNYILGQRVGRVTGRRGSQAGGSGESAVQDQAGGSRSVELPGAPGIDLAGLLQRIEPQAAPRPAPMAPPSFAALPRFAGQPVPVPSGGPVEGAPLDLAGILSSSRSGPSTIEQQVPGSQSSRDESGSVSSKTGGRARGKSPLFEMFYNGPGGINVDNGRRVPRGFVSGHTGHVHVAAGPKTVDRLGRMAQRMGLRVGENETFDKVDPVHTGGSFHYRNRAIDVSGDPRRLREFNRRVAGMYGIGA